MRKRFFFLIILSLLFTAMDFFKVSTFFRQPFEPVIVSFKKTIYQGFYQIKFLPTILVNYNRLLSDIGEKQNLIVQNRQMKLQLVDLEEDNESLRRQLGAPLPPSYKFIPADVIAVSRYMEINAGEAQGVRTGMVVVEGLTLIGRVSKVTERRSQVQLVSDSDFEILAISNRGSRGKVNGAMGKFLLFNSVLQKDPLFLDDTLFTTGENNYPPNLLIGTVAHIENDDVAVYKKAQVKSFAQPAELKKVYIIDET